MMSYSYSFLCFIIYKTCLLCMCVDFVVLYITFLHFAFRCAASTPCLSVPISVSCFHIKDFVIIFCVLAPSDPYAVFPPFLKYGHILSNLFCMLYIFLLAYLWTLSSYQIVFCPRNCIYLESLKVLCGFATFSLLHLFFQHR